MTIFKVTALPASYGDSLWIEYGPEDAPCVVLIDAGPTAPAELRTRLKSLIARNGQLELVVVTHIDCDHIGGMLTMLRERFLGVPIRDLWFNGYQHLPPLNESFGPKQGEEFTKELLAGGWSWNNDFGNGAVVVNDDAPKLPEVSLALGAVITLLSPDTSQLSALRDTWIDVCGDAGLYINTLAGAEPPQAIDGNEAFGGVLPDVDHLATQPFKEDRATANGSSIAFIFEYDNKRVLFGADAFPSRILKSLAKYERLPHDFALVKLPHHGSHNNVSVDLIEALRSPIYLFSTDGKKFRHPSPSGVARVIKHGQSPLLAFNYQSEFTENWFPLLLGNNPFTCIFGDQGSLTIDLAS
jgi:beta-lactamase superfamily II metal-dependent hydrolase